MFYNYTQNNSGGSFDFDAIRGITHHVIVEASNVADANEQAEEIGLYFDSDMDCECCGSRWSDQWYGDDATDVPMVYGTPVEDYEDGKRGMKWMGANPEIFVHYTDGSFKGYWN